MHIDVNILMHLTTTPPNATPSARYIGAPIREGRYICKNHIETAIIAYIIPLFRTLLVALKVVFRCKKKLKVWDITYESAKDKNAHRPPLSGEYFISHHEKGVLAYFLNTRKLKIA